jgi:hypothetical protein
MHIDWSSVVTNLIVVVVIPIIVPPLAAWLFAKAMNAWKEFRMNQPNLAYALDVIAPLVVKAAEQMHVAGYIEDKKTYALDLAQKYLEAHGIKNVQLEVIEAAIEAAVFDAFTCAAEDTRQAGFPLPEV